MFAARIKFFCWCIRLLTFYTKQNTIIIIIITRGYLQFTSDLPASSEVDPWHEEAFNTDLILGLKAASLSLGSYISLLLAVVVLWEGRAGVGWQDRACVSPGRILMTEGGGWGDRELAGGPPPAPPAPRLWTAVCAATGLTPLPTCHWFEEWERETQCMRGVTPRGSQANYQEWPQTDSLCFHRGEQLNECREDSN